MTIRNLPINSVIPELKSALSEYAKVILQAPPGAGKTTAVPLSLLDEAWLNGKKIIMLSPRRVAARTAASRMAASLGEKVGERVGYQIRSEKKLSERTQILVVTEGILTRYLQNDPALEDAALIIFDEFHERNLHADLSLAFALQSQECLRDDLKILVMSATLDTRGLGELLGNPPIITSEGKCYPVDIVYRPANSRTVDPKNAVPEAFQTLKNALEADEGDILVFLQGEREIRDLAGLVESYRQQRNLDLFIAPLYGSLTKEEQERAIFPSTLRKVVIATNIAETSLTIEGIRIVIDSGFERISRFDPAGGMERLVTQKISRASAEQRTGRAGRTAEGKCYRLWSEHAHYSLSPYRDPEIRSCDLTPLALELGVWGASADELRWIDPPAPAALSHAVLLLRSMDAVAPNELATGHGKALLTLGVHPRLAHMIIRAKEFECESEAILLAALLNERDIFTGVTGRTTDLRDRYATVLAEIDNKSRQPGSPLAIIIQNARDIAGRMGCRLRFDTDFLDERIGILLALAFPDRIARKRSGTRNRYLTTLGKEAYLSEEDENNASEWLVIARSDGHDTMSRIHLCSPISLESLETFFPDLFTLDQTITFNNNAMRVESREIRRMGEIIVDSHPISHPDTERVKAVLIDTIRQQGLGVLRWSETARTMLERLRACAFHRPDIMDKDYSEHSLLERLEEWLMPHLTTHSSIRECETLDMALILSASLGWEQKQMIDRLFPERFAVPTETQIAIDYSNPESPILGVRIQEMFGTTVHPAIMDGKLPLSVHLLSPAHRPIQVTRDLIGFWNGSYTDVKKELKGRYPKHFWPDNPANALPTKRTKNYIKKPS